MAFRSRKSKYKHVYADEPKPEAIFQDYRLNNATGDQQWIKASANYFAVSLMSGGGGPVAITPINKPGRYTDIEPLIITGHAGSVLDFDFNPFDDSMIATGSEDCEIKVWSIPSIEDNDAAAAPKSLTSESFLVNLSGHRKKVSYVKFHPTVANLLLSASADATVRLWNIETGDEIWKCDAFGDIIQDVVFDLKGDLVAASCKDKIVRIIDARTGAVKATIPNVHDGLKSTKLSFLGHSGKLLTVGFKKPSGREFKVWDVNNIDDDTSPSSATTTLSTPLITEAIDGASSIIIPLFDSDTNVLYLCGKGESGIRYYEYDNDHGGAMHELSAFRSKDIGKGFCLLPKRANNVMACETARIFKMTSDAVHPLSFTVPRKQTEAFQDDIFPDCAAPEPAHTLEEWLAGSSKLPVTMSLDPKKAKGIVKKKMKSAIQLNADLQKAEERIKYLEEKLRNAGIEF